MKPVKIFLFACSIGSAWVLTGAASAQSTDEQKSVLQTNFQAADTNGDSALDRDEFKAFINANAESDLGRQANPTVQGLRARIFEIGRGRR